LKKYGIVSLFTLLFFLYSCLVHKNGKQALIELQRSPLSSQQQDSFFIIDAGKTEEGIAKAGYEYLLHGNIFSSGIPYGLYRYVLWAKRSKMAMLTGQNNYVVNDFIVFLNEAGKLTATPGCLHCHSQQFNNKLVIGLGNSYSHFQTDKTPLLKSAEKAIKLFYGKNSDEWKSAQRVFRSGYMLAPELVTEMQGPSPAHRIAEVMASHRDPQTLIFRADTSYFSIPPIVIPTDIPPLWVLKKKKAFTINAMEQGSFLKHLMSPAILTLKDTTEAKKIYDHINNVWAYLNTLRPPAYPYPVNQQLAANGKIIFEKKCSRCHGTYGENEWYPNKIIPGQIIGTDSLMIKYYKKYPEYSEWYNKSWFATSSPAAYITPQAGYVPPPLDGVWCTAPYFHNGSVPTLEGVLNSKKRPRFWKRNFSREKYNYNNVGWKYEAKSKARGKKTYNTDIPGYGNYGHYFGDHLSDTERKAVIEYLKCL
jgi:hypothetical protein